MFAKMYTTFALVCLSVNLVSGSPSPSADVPAQYPIKLYNQTLCKGFIETAYVLNQECFNFPPEKVVSVRIPPNSIPAGWEWHAYSSTGCQSSDFVGIITQGGCQTSTEKGYKIEGLVKSVNVVAPS